MAGRLLPRGYRVWPNLFGRGKLQLLHVDAYVPGPLQRATGRSSQTGLQVAAIIGATAFLVGAGLFLWGTPNIGLPDPSLPPPRITTDLPPASAPAAAPSRPLAEAHVETSPETRAAPVIVAPPSIDPAPTRLGSASDVAPPKPNLVEVVVASANPATPAPVGSVPSVAEVAISSKTEIAPKQDPVVAVTPPVPIIVAAPPPPAVAAPASQTIAQPATVAPPALVMPPAESAAAPVTAAQVTPAPVPVQSVAAVPSGPEPTVPPPALQVPTSKQARTPAKPKPIRAAASAARPSREWSPPQRAPEETGSTPRRVRSLQTSEPAHRAFTLPEALRPSGQ